jgi:hypothetical protein
MVYLFMAVPKVAQSDGLVRIFMIFFEYNFASFGLAGQGSGLYLCATK